MWLVVVLAVVVVLPSPQLHLYVVIESPGKGALLPEALKLWETPTVTVRGLWITATGDSGWNAAIPMGVPTPDTPS